MVHTAGVDISEDLGLGDPDEQTGGERRPGPEDAIVNAPAAAAVEAAPFDSLGRADDDDPPRVFPSR